MWMRLGIVEVVWPNYYWPENQIHIIAHEWF